MKTLNQRVKELRKAKGMTQAVFAKKIGLTQPTLSFFENGDGTTTALPEMARELGMTVEELLTGEENPYKGHVVPVVAWNSQTPLEDDEVAIPFFKDFYVACGNGTIGEALESETRRLRLSKSTLKGQGVEYDKAIAVTSFGNSNDPEIKDRATVYVDLGDTTISDGCVYLIGHDGTYKFKYLYNLPKGGIRVVSKNSDEYPEERLTAEEIIDQNFQILGYAFDVQNPLPRRRK